MEEQKTFLDEFIGLYPVSKTLRFELKPLGRTQEYIERDGVLDTDFHRAESYKKVKTIIDRYHKQFIDDALSGIQLQDMDKFQMLYSMGQRDEKQDKEFKNIQASLRKQIVQKIQAHPKYKNLFKKEFIKNELVEFTKNNQEEKTLVEEFQDFSTYFTGFYQNRANMYSDEEKSTAIAYRIVHQNFPKFLDNMKVFMMVQNNEINDKLEGLLFELKKKVKIESIEEYFELSGFNKVITQKGIDTYNLILGAYSDENKEKIQGLNEFINLYNQKTGSKIPKMKPLFKQILSDKEKVSFVLEEFESDAEVLEAINKFYSHMQQEIFCNEEQINISELLSQISSYDIDRIYIKNDGELTTISKYIFGDWAYINTAIGEHYDRNYVSSKKTNKNTEKYEETKKKALKKIKSYSIGELNEIVQEYAETDACIEDYFIHQITEKIDKINHAYDACRYLFNPSNKGKGSILKNDEVTAQIKNLLDAVKELQWLIKPLVGGQENSQKDEAFYAELLRIWERLDEVTLLYNKVRNYVTKKPYSLEKVKLNFFKSTLLDGWDKNKERDNLGIIMMKDGLYYLGIMNRNCNRVMDEAPKAVSDKRYHKMEYKLLPGPNKMLPKVFFSKSRIDEFAPSERIIEKYKKGTHKKGDNFSLTDCHELIDFFKNSIQKHEEWSKFDFQFSDTETYEDISGFYREVEHQGYKITFKDIDESYIDELVENGQLYLFQIYNKDFSPYSKGKPNLHTMYWKMLFSPENLKNVVYKLNGQAEIFYRKASIAEEDIVTHEAGKPIANRDLSAEKKESTFDYTLTKDKRFTVDKYQFHVPITMNFQASGENHINRKVNQVIHDVDDIHVIGIDRGERNLLYVSVIDKNGTIEKQMSLNEIVSCDQKGLEHKKDYHQLLDIREKENKMSRQNWKTVNTIKELKEGYLSQAVHVITQLMVEYHAIVVLEDLNFGFMRSRQKVEKQVYQKFEKMLIQKLNYLVDKDRKPEENGGLLHAYQLTDKLENFQSKGKQSGLLYYVPAWNTSKLDPTTGFVNLFYTKYESMEKTREFILKFDSIRYNRQNKYFEFAFDYSKFTYKAEGSRTNWCICSYGKRIENYRNPEKDNNWDARKVDLTKELKELFMEYQIFHEDQDLREYMVKIDKADFYKRFLRLFSLILQMRNSDATTGEDKLCSPVINSHGDFFESGKDKNMPMDADANGAYNIARKGLWIVEQIQKTDIDKLDNLKLAMSNKEWLQYAQEHTL